MGFIIGGLIGILVVRSFFLSFFEEAMLRIFLAWTFDVFDPKTVLTSSTFAKFAAGFLIGGVAGVIVERQLKRSRGNSQRS